MTKSKKIRNGPNLEKHIRKKHRYATYLEASRLFSIPYYSLVRIAKEANACWKIRKTVIVDKLQDYIENFREGDARAVTKSCDGTDKVDSWIE